MSKMAEVKKALEWFLTNERPGVLAIKGQWGVGKTYFWNRFIEAKKGDLKAVAYSYVSLFGIGSITELRRAIFTKQEILGEGAGKSLQWLLRRAASVLRGVDLGGVTMGTLKNTEIWSELVQDKLLKNFVICIDDLERKESQVTASSLLGFISSLRDERDCKVVLLYNSSEIPNGSDLEKCISEYREKVFDREVAFDPDIDECFTIIFGEEPERYKLPEVETGYANPFLDKDSRTLLEIFRSLNVANIRVLRKTKDALDYFEPELKAKYPKLWAHFSRQTVKLCCLHYLYGDMLPLDSLIKTSAWGDLFAERNNDPKKRADYDRRKPVRDIGYSPLDTDPLIVEFLSRGFVEWELHSELLTAQEKRHHLTELGGRLSNNWGLLWKNFQASQKDFIRHQVEFVEKHFDELAIWEIDEIAHAIGELEPTPRIEDLLSKKIADFAARFDGDTMYSDGIRKLRKETAEKIQQLLSKKTVSKSISETFVLLTQRDSWNSKDTRFLSSTTADDFYHWLVSESHDDLLHRLKEFRSRFKEDKEGGPIVEKLDAALRRLAGRSNIDAFRIYSNIGIERPTPVAVENVQPKP